MAESTHESPSEKLAKYRSMRDFSVTPEPAGKAARTAEDELSFVVQEHHASRLHYDFRLELDGVLLSWAVPKGPSLDPADRRLAVRTEDHPIEYGGFEGIIPEGEYGGGTVVLWDRGRWSPTDDPRSGLKRGKLDFTLDGEKLTGRWKLVRMTGERSEGGKNWLLIKGKDEVARPGEGEALVEGRPESVVSGRTADEIASEPERVWDRRGEREPTAAERGRLDPGALAGAQGARLPKTLEPQLATLVAEVPGGDDWLHEIKLDGYRVLLRLERGTGVALLTRNGKDWTDRFAPIAEAAAGLPADAALLDGEVVVVGPAGRSDFAALQQALGRGGDRSALVYYAFDLLHLDGHDLRRAPLAERKELLAELLAGADGDGTVRYSDHVAGRGDDVYARACGLGLEGVISKRRASPYRSGRNRDWLKTKCLARQELVVGGFTEPSGSRTGLGALLVGVHDGDGSLRYAGKVGTGFTTAVLAELRERLEPLERDRPPFADPPRERGARWVEPELVAEVAFTEWTRDGLLRHPSFQGLREDKDPREVVREGADGAPAPATKARPRGGGTMPDETRAETASAKKTSGKKTPGKKKATGRKRPGGPIEIAGVRLTSPDKVLYPDQGVTKRDLADFYLAIADWIEPHVAGRPLSLVRCPQGREKKCFYQKHADDSFPEAIGKVEVPEKDGSAFHVAVRDIAGVLSLVQLGVLEIHVWGARRDRVERPDRMVFDLDPDEGLEWRRVVEAAHDVRERLSALGLESFVKTTGGKGLHVVVPLERRSSWDEVKAFSHALARRMEAEEPERYVSNMSKAKRRGRIFVDYLRNSRGATWIAPYSTRARSGAPVSTPLRWNELTPRVRPDRYTVENLPRRLRSLAGDPWEGIEEVRQRLTAAMWRELGTDRPS